MTNTSAGVEFWRLHTKVSLSQQSVILHCQIGKSLVVASWHAGWSWLGFFLTSSSNGGQVSINVLFFVILDI